MKTIYETPTKKSREKTIEYLTGDCLEDMGLFIPNNGIAVVDHTIRPEIGDLVICRKNRDALNAYCKQVKSIGDVVTVGTCYVDKSKDFTFDAEVISGVVIQVFDKLFHSLIYER